MLAPHEPTWLEWAEVLAVTVLWYVGPALARDALDHCWTGPDAGPAGGRTGKHHDPHRSRPVGRPRRARQSSSARWPRGDSKHSLIRLRPRPTSTRAKPK